MTQDTLIHSRQEDTLAINVHDDGTHRWLDFGDGAIQSIIDLKNPQTLASPVHQATMAGLLFLPAPQSMLLLGLGGGAIARFMAHHQPTCQGVAVEISPAVANIARHYFDFPPAWGLHLGNAREYPGETHDEPPIDYIVVDIAERLHTPEWICSEPFLAQCRHRLSSHGVLAINLVPHNADEFSQQLAAIRTVFPARTLCLSVPEHHNVMVFGFVQHSLFTHIAELQSRITGLEQQWPLPFTAFLERMIHDNPEGSGVF